MTDSTRCDVICLRRRSCPATALSVIERCSQCRDDRLPLGEQNLFPAQILETKAGCHFGTFFRISQHVAWFQSEDGQPVEGGRLAGERLRIRLDVVTCAIVSKAERGGLPLA